MSDLRVQQADARLARLRKKANGLPLLPGVYLMRNAKKRIIYIGKAKQLKNRVSQYFRNQASHTQKVRQMVAQVEDFEYIVCDSEFEALILECSLIKQHMPKYNILLKDDKGYHYIRITKDDWPDIQAVKQAGNDKATYLGPYHSGYIVCQTVDEAKKIFKLPQCGKRFPLSKPQKRPCLNFHIGCCCGPCTGKISREAYLEAVTGAVGFIKGGGATSVATLRRQMQHAADALEFERAARLRDRLTAIEKIRQRQKVMAGTYQTQDVVAFVKGTQTACFEVFRYRGGKLCDREQFLVDLSEDGAAARAEFLRRYYSMREDVPPRIALDGPFEDAPLMQRFLSEKAGRKVMLVVPRKGEQKALVEMCRNNAAQYLAEQTGRPARETVALDELAALLGLHAPPHYIEAYDISHTAGSENVGGMTVFLDGKPLKSAYRRFRIKGFTGQDDFASLREVLSRRLDEYEKHKDSGEGFGRLPDLILLDGGAPQLNAVRPLLEERGFSIPLFGMVKDGRHKTRAIAAGGGDIEIQANRKAYGLIYAIQEETHRFAITYHRNRSVKKGLTSELCAIPGVGPKTAAALLKHFKTLKTIRTAAPDALAAVRSVNRRAAQAVYDFYHTADSAES